MKKSILKSTIAAFAILVAFTSCSQDTPVDSGSEMIAFRALSDKASKATVTDASNFLNFKVFAYTSTDAALPTTGMTPKFMYGVDVARATVSSSWLYTPAKYWPANANVHFFAYSPSTSTAASFATASGVEGQPLVNYTVANNVTSQEDFIWSNVEGANKTTHGASPVQFTFKHALSQIVFQAKSGNESVEFSISKIELIGANNTGVFNLKSGTWGTPSGNVNYVLDNAILTNNTAINSTSFVNLSGTNGAMMILPQALVGGQASPINPLSGAYLKITYGAKDKSSQEVLVNPGTELTVPFTLNLLQNKKYVIQMTLTGVSDNGNELVQIDFSGTVSDWENGGTSAITM